MREYANRLWGEVLLFQPISARILTPLLGVGLCGIALFIASGSYARSESVTGYVSASVGVVKLFPLRAGSASSVRVEAGEPVTAGQVLVTASSNAALADGSGVGEALREDLVRQREEIRRRIRAGEELLARRLAFSSEQLESQRAQLAQSRSLRETLVERERIARDRVHAYQALLRKEIISPAHYGSERDRSLELRAELTQVSERVLSGEERIQRARQAIEVAPLEWEEKRAELELRLAQIAAQLTEVESRSSFAVASSIAGRVAALSATPGGRLDPAVPVAVILPEGGRLDVCLLVPTRAIGFVRPGQRVRIRFDAFPYRRFGAQPGTVARVESTVLAPHELRAPVTPAEPVYRVIVELDAQSVRAYGAAYPLQVGMRLEADIVLEERTLLQWLLEPLYSARGGS